MGFLFEGPSDPFPVYPVHPVKGPRSAGSHTTTRRRICQHLHLVHVTFSFQFLLSNTVGLVPVKLRESHTTVGKTDAGNPLHLPPAALTVDSTKPSKFPNPTPTGNRLGLRNLAKNLEVHDESFCHGTSHSSINRNNDYTVCTIRQRQTALFCMNLLSLSSFSSSNPWDSITYLLLPP